MNPDYSLADVLDTRTYDAAGNLLQDNTDDQETTDNYTVDAAGRVTTATVGGVGDTSVARTTAVTFDPDDHPVSVSQSQAGSPTVDTTDYTHDPMGRMTSQTVHDSTAAQASAA